MQKETRSLNFIDLFAGAGGLSEGFIREGFTPKIHIEMNNDAAQTLITRNCYYYCKKHGKMSIYRKYLRKEISRDDFYKQMPKRCFSTVVCKEISDANIEQIFAIIDKTIMNTKIDIIIGGPPCQAYSLIGRSRVGKKIREDPRNILYKQYAKFLEKYSPELFVFENVPGLLTANSGQSIKDITDTMNRTGYEIEYHILSATDYGVLQNRHRIILVGWKKNSNYHYPDITLNSFGIFHVQDLFSDLPPLKHGEENNTYITGPTVYLKKSGIRCKKDILTEHICRPNSKQDIEIYKKTILAWNEEKKRLNYTDLPVSLCTHKNKTDFLDRFKVVAGDIKASQTMTAHIAKDGHYYIHPDLSQARSISVREAARIQSFPDNYYFEGSRTSAFAQIGNAVPPLLAQSVAKSIKKMIFSGDAENE